MERSRRGVRRQISDTPDEVSEQSASESEQDWEFKKAETSRKAGKNERLSASPNATRSRRAAAADDTKQSIKLTMKVAPSKLREVMRANEVDSLQDVLGGGKVIDGPRSRRSLAPRASARAANRPRYAEYGESDIDDEEEDDEEEAEDEDMNDFDEVGAEVEGGTDEEDAEMNDIDTSQLSNRPSQAKQTKLTLKPPPMTVTKPGPKAKSVVKLPPDIMPFKSVEEQEMEDAEEDEDEDEEGLSDLSEDEDATNLQEVEGDTMMMEEEEEEEEEDDGEGEDEELDGEEGSDGDSDDENSASNMGTPDPTKLTKRQRGRPEDQTTLLALDMAPQQRKFFTDEEKAMKKDEHARKRKELTKRKINEEKTAALNRLLKPQVSKARGAAPKPETLAAAAAAAAGNTDNEIVENVDPLYVRWISNKDGIRLGVPEEWLGKNVGRNFGPPPVPKPSPGVLVQEIE